MSNPTTSRKSLKSFNVRDGLWKLFEVRAAEMDCSVDYLINEAMRLYARTHNFAASIKVDPTAGSVNTGVATSSGITGPGITESETGVPRMTGVAPMRPSMAPVPHPSVLRAQLAQPPVPPVPTASGSVAVPFPSPNTGVSVPKPVPLPTPEIQQVSQVSVPRLTIIFQGRKIPITAQSFVIGRGSKSSDLAIKDPNISRRHAEVILHNGLYYIRDLGSTNGIEYKGKNVDSKRIDEGDVFTICGYDLHFTYSV